MRLTPRSEEVKAVRAILESDGFPTADAMAKALIKEVADILSMREWFAAAVEFPTGERTPAFGLFSSSIDAIAVMKKVGLSGEVKLAKLYSAGQLLANVEGRPGWPGFCQTCGHAPFWHAAKGAARGKCVPDDCTCDEFKK